jgi:hypothetical protein
MRAPSGTVRSAIYCSPSSQSGVGLGFIEPSVGAFDGIGTVGDAMIGVAKTAMGVSNLSVGTALLETPGVETGAGRGEHAAINMQITKNRCADLSIRMTG